MFTPLACRAHTSTGWEYHDQWEENPLAADGHVDIHVLDDSGASCNTLLSDSGNSGTPVNVIVGLFLTCAGLAWAAFSATGSAMGGNTGKTGNTYTEL